MNCTNNKCIPREVHTQQRYSLVLKHHVKCKKNKSISRSKSIAQSAQTTRVFLVLPAKSTARSGQKTRRYILRDEDGMSIGNAQRIPCSRGNHARCPNNKCISRPKSTTRGARTINVFLVLKVPRRECTNNKSFLRSIKITTQSALANVFLGRKAKRTRVFYSF